MVNLVAAELIKDNVFQPFFKHSARTMLGLTSNMGCKVPRSHSSLQRVLTKLEPLWPAIKSFTTSATQQPGIALIRTLRPHAIKSFANRLQFGYHFKKSAVAKRHGQSRSNSYQSL